MKHEPEKLKSGPQRTKRGILWDLKNNHFFYLISIPALIVMIMFSYIPMAGIYVAFERYTFEGGLFGSEFVGFDNFRFFFANIRNALRATRNTIVINFGGIVFGILLQLITAISLGEILNEKFRKGAQTAILFPYFLSWIVVGTLADTLLANNGGLLNQLIELFGGKPILWSTKPKYWWTIIITASVWKGFGYGSIVYYATLTGFDPTLYEAAEIDGASRWAKIQHITIPLLRPTIVILFLLSVGGILKGSLDQIMGMTRLNPLILETTDTITTFVYRTTTQNGQFGTAAAISLYQSVFGCLMVLGANYLAKKIDPDYALF